MVARWSRYMIRRALQEWYSTSRETVELRNKMKLLMKHMPESVYLLTYRNDCLYSQVRQRFIQPWPYTESAYRAMFAAKVSKTRRETEQAWRYG